MGRGACFSTPVEHMAGNPNWVPHPCNVTANVRLGCHTLSVAVSAMYTLSSGMPRSAAATCSTDAWEMHQHIK